MILESCVCQFDQVKAAIANGARRIELNADLAQGGVTPSLGLIKQTVSFAHQHNVPVIVMLRPRGGNFVYDDDEQNIMALDLQTLEDAGVDGIAVGMLLENGELDKNGLLKLLQDTKLELVFHMAFDEIINQKDAIDWLSSHQFHRILTHGGSLKEPLNIPHLQKLIEYAQDKIEILPGGGITAKNKDDIVSQLKVSQLHGTKVVATTICHDDC